MTALAFSPDGAALGSGDSEGQVVVRTLPELRVASRLSYTRSRIRSMAFATNFLASALTRQTSVGPRLPWLLAVGDEGGTITIWDLDRWQLKSACPGSPHEVKALAFNPDGTLLASGGRDEVFLWDVATGQKVLRIEGEKNASVNNLRALAFTADGRRLAGVGEFLNVPPSLFVMEVDAGRGIATLRGLRSQISRVWWAPNGKLVAGLAHDWDLGVWEADSGRLLRVFEATRGLSADNAAVAFFPDGKRLGYVSGTNACVYRIDTGAMERTIPLPVGLADHLRYENDGKLLLVRREAASAEGSRLGTWRLRNLLGSAPGRALFEQQNTNWLSYNLALPEKGDKFFVWSRGGAGDDKTSVIRAFGLADGKQKWVKATESLEADLACDSNGEFGVYCPKSGQAHAIIRLLDAQTGPSLTGKYAHALSFSRKRFSYGDAGAGCLFYAPELPAEGLRLAMDWRMALLSEFSPDGSRLAWGTEDGLVLVADLNEVLRRLHSFSNDGQ